MKKILYTGVGHEIGGVELLVKQIVAKNLKKYEIHILAATDQQVAFEKYFLDNDVRIHYLKNIFGLKSALRRKFILRNFFDSEQFDIIHINANSLNASYMAKIATNVGCKKIIYHVHNVEPSGQKFLIKLLTKLLMGFNRKRLRKLKQVKIIAVSGDVKERVFGLKLDVEVVLNGITVDNYLFSEEKRSNIREEYSIKVQDRVGVIVARLTPLKNYQKTVEIVNYGIEHQIFDYFFIIGEGSERPNIEKQISTFSDYSQKRILMIGQRENIVDYLSASDFFLLTSINEGLANSVIEAQSNGLPCVISNGVPESVDVTGNVSFVALTEDSKQWNNVIRQSLSRKISRKAENLIVANSPLSSKVFLNRLERLYEEK